ncbi:MAG: GIY-YIG nuclease family protein [bacterium]|nr:GIY-YIG nuclease family protein [bacterium]
MLTKEEIIREIQKEAKENDGKAPSEKDLEVNAGIKNYEWHKYWSKITDAQIEAGLTPNTFFKTPHEPKDLCEKFIDLMRELRKWPTKAEIEVKHNKEKSFPGSSIFYRKLGKIKDLANNILEYAKDNNYDDVIEICNEVLEKYKNIDEPEKNGTEKVAHGWVYLIKHGNHNQYRVGKATNLLQRLGQNRIELPERAIPVHSIETTDITGVETYWLNHFKPKRLNGDWFNLSRADVNEFKRWKRIV